MPPIGRASERINPAPGRIFLEPTFVELVNVTTDEASAEWPLLSDLLIKLGFGLLIFSPDSRNQLLEIHLEAET